MTAASLSQLLSLFGGHGITAFMLVLARVAPLFIVAPVFSSKMVPPRVRGIMAVALSLGLTGVASHGERMPTDALPIAGALIEQLLVGLGFAFAISALLSAVEAAGAITDALAGFSFGGMIDPINGSQGGVLTQFYSLVGALVFLVIGGDAWVLRGLTRTFTLVPLTDPVRIGSLVAGAEQAFSTILVSAVEVAAPALLALMITDVAFGIVSKVMPQLNVFAVGFPLKVGVSLLIVGTTLALIGGWMSNQLQSSVGTALSALQIG